MIQTLGKAPQWFLAIVLMSVLTLAWWQTRRWVEHVEQHIDESNQGYQRIAALEARVRVLEIRALACEARHRSADEP